MSGFFSPIFLPEPYIYSTDVISAATATPKKLFLDQMSASRKGNRAELFCYETSRAQSLHLRAQLVL